MTTDSHDYSTINRDWWEKIVQDDDCGFTQPWLDLDKDLLQKIARWELKNTPAPLNDIYPTSVLADVSGKNILCLASGGGQQSAVFSLLGAHVTVVDIAEGQLEGDRRAADHYGYEIETIQWDMSDLSMLPGDFFDLVYQAPSMVYIPDVGKVYSGVARILKTGGLYRVDAHNPQSVFFDESSWDGKGYRIDVPYCVKKKQRSETENILEYRHHLDEIFNGLIENGLTIEGVEEMPKDLYRDESDEPGSWGHSLEYLPGTFAILARKR